MQIQFLAYNCKYCLSELQLGPSMMWFFYTCCRCSMRSFSKFLPGQPRSDISQNLCPATQCTHAAGLQHACTIQLGQPIGTEMQYACCSLQHAYTMQLGKDSEKYNFQASQAENLEKQVQVQHAQKKHIIDGPSCTIVGLK